MSAPDSDFARLVSLACHDLRTPLATVHGFASTLPRMADVDEKMLRYLRLMEAATGQLAELLDDLALVARIEGGRYQPTLRDGDTLELARAAAERIEDKVVAVSGDGGRVTVDPEAAARAVYNLARGALRHGGLDRLELHAEGPALTFAPVAPDAGAILLANELRDFGAAVAARVVRALGGSLELDGERLVVRLAPVYPGEAAPAA